MLDVYKLFKNEVIVEEDAHPTPFLAPCLRGSRVRVLARGRVNIYRIIPADFEGWGIFRSRGNAIADLTGYAEPTLINHYLSRFASLSVRLIYPLRGNTWLAYPSDEDAAKQIPSAARPVAVHLVVDGAVFAKITARFDGNAWWYQSIEEPPEDLVTNRLREALQNEVIMPDDLNFDGITSEMKTAYSLAAQQELDLVARIRHEREQDRLRNAFGGVIPDFYDRGDLWHVTWTTNDGLVNMSVIDKHDLTVVSSGLSLIGRHP